MGSFIHVGDRKGLEMSAGSKKAKLCTHPVEVTVCSYCFKSHYPSLTASLAKVEALHKRIGSPKDGETYCAIFITYDQVNAIKDVLELARITLERKKA